MRRSQPSARCSGLARPALAAIQPIGVRAEAMLPECHQELADIPLDGGRLGRSRKFQHPVVQFATRIAGIEEDTKAPKSRFSFLPGALRSATTTT